MVPPVGEHHKSKIRNLPALKKKRFVKCFQCLKLKPRSPSIRVRSLERAEAEKWIWKSEVCFVRENKARMKGGEECG